MYLLITLICEVAVYLMEEFFLLPDFKNMKHAVEMTHEHFIEIHPSLYHA